MERVEFEALWPRARRYAARYCAGTLARLRQGDGGFYEADDLWQDIYLAFHALAEAWQASTADEEGREAFYEAWQKQLARGGWRIYRRAPQRLWAGAELAAAPADLALESDGAAPEDSDNLPCAVLAQLTQPEDSAALYERMERLRLVERALWQLRPVQRQTLYLTAMRAMPAARTARLLGIANAAAVYDRMYDARQFLRREAADGRP